MEKEMSIHEKLSVARGYLEDVGKDVVAFVKKHNVICVKTNVIGTHKNTLYAPVVTKYFERKIDTLIKEKNIKLVDKKTNVSLDGNYILYLFR